MGPPFTNFTQKRYFKRNDFLNSNEFKELELIPERLGTEPSEEQPKRVHKVYVI